MTWPQLLNRFLDMVDELINTRTILAVGSLAGFFYVATRVLERLSNPPASELFTILNLVMAPVLLATGYYFGSKTNGKNGGGTPPQS